MIPPLQILCLTRADEWFRLWCIHRRLLFGCYAFWALLSYVHCKHIL